MYVVILKMYKYQATYNKTLSDLYYKCYIKIQAARELNLNLVDIEAYNIVMVYLNQADSEISLPSAYFAKKNILELLVYLKSELGLHKPNTGYNITIKALIGVLNNLKPLLDQLHTLESKLTIQELI